MKPTDSSDHDRLLELLADQTLAGLDADQQRELESLLQANPDFDIAAMDRTAAMLDIAAFADALQPLPERLRNRIRMHEQSLAEPLGKLPAATQSRNKIHWREAVAWMTAAACLVLAVFAWSRWPADNPASGPDANPLSLAGKDPALTRNQRPDNARADIALTIAGMREQLLVSADDVLHLQLVSNEGAGDSSGPGGDIVWSSRQQIGYLRLHGLTKLGPAPSQYQLWIVGSDASGNEIVNAGVFPVDRHSGELILPIHADQFVQQPKMFVVSMKPSGSSNDFISPLMAKADGQGL